MSLMRVDLSLSWAKEAVDSFLRQTVNDSRGTITRLAQLLEGLTNGAINKTSMKLLTGAVQATATVTFSGRPTANQTMSLLNVTLTAKDSGANGTTEFNTSGSDDTVTAANLAACINANTTLNKQVSAVAAAKVVTITSLVAGVIGNGLQASEGMDNTALVAFAGGAQNSAIDL